MKTFNASDMAHKRTEIFEAAKDGGCVIERKNTNGEVLADYVILKKSQLLELLWDNSTYGDRNNKPVCDLIESINEREDEE